MFSLYIYNVAEVVAAKLDIITVDHGSDCAMHPCDITAPQRNIIAIDDDIITTVCNDVVAVACNVVAITQAGVITIHHAAIASKECSVVTVD